MSSLFTPIAGNVLTAAQVLQLQPIRAVKLSDVAIASSTTLVADSALFVPLATSAEYEVTVHVIYTANAAGLLSIGFSGPAGATFDWLASGLANTVTASDSGDGTFLSRAITDTKNLGAAGSSTAVVVRITGRAVTSSTAGNLTFKWAQTVSSGNGTTVKSGSYMIARQIA